MTVKEARRKGTQVLSQNRTETQTPTPSLDADVLLEHVLGWNKTAILFHGEKELTPKQEEDFFSYIKVRSTGLPVAYISGHKEFFGYDFFVTPSVLIPKPDTEVLVEEALNVLKEKVSASPRKSVTICDMCTGSGCIALSIAKSALENHIVTKENFPLITMADISAPALEIARTNRDALLPDWAKENVRLVQSNLFCAVDGRFDIITANPPYIPYSMVRELLKDGRNEPALALDGDVTLTGEKSKTDDGLAIMRNLVLQAKDHITLGGILLCEAGEYNAEMTQYIFKKNGFTKTKIFRDLGGDLRCVFGVSATF